MRFLANKARARIARLVFDGPQRKRAPREWGSSWCRREEMLNEAVRFMESHERFCIVLEAKMGIKVTVDQLLSRSRTEPLAHIRSAAMFAIRARGETLHTAASALHRMHHTTAMSAEKKCRNWIEIHGYNSPFGEVIKEALKVYAAYRK